MSLSQEVKDAIAAAVDGWARNGCVDSLMIRKVTEDAIVIEPERPSRVTKQEFAAELGIGRNIFRRMEDHFGLAPDSGRMYSRETVEDVKRWLRNEEQRTRAPWLAKRHFSAPPEQ